MAKQTDAANELWSQIFGRQAKEEYAAVENPLHDPSDDKRKMRAAMTSAGWTEAQIDVLAAAHDARDAAAPVTSPNVNRSVEAALGRLCDDVESAMVRLGKNSHVTVARGVEPRLGPFAAKTNVILTDESIVTVGAFLFRYCGLIARAFTRTLLLNPSFWESGDWTEQKAMALIARQPALMWYWLRIQMSFAVTGTHILTSYEPSKPEEVLLMEQVARGMEIFAIAHEYGHHDLDHGRSLSDDPIAEEFAADQFALRIGTELERFPFLIENPYLAGGAGGAILLLALENLRDVADVILGRRSTVSTTHPAPGERIARFDSVAVLEPKEFAYLKRFRLVATRIIAVVGKSLVQGAQGMPAPLRDMLRESAAPV